MNDFNASNFEKVETPVRVSWVSRALRICMALVIIGGGLAGAAYLMKTVEKPKKRPPAKWVPVVRVLPAQHTDYQVMVNATGTVVPARRIMLRAHVSGQVLSVHPEFSDGGYLARGATVVALDDADYRLALAQKQSDAVNSQYALKVEQGRQEVARREWQLLGNEELTETSGTALALREPHLEKARADVESARLHVQKAQLDLERARVSAPFNAKVISRHVNVGSQVSPQDTLAELVGTDSYWVRASVPVDRLDQITIPGKTGVSGSAVQVHYARNHVIAGRVIRLLGDLDTESRMARLLIEVRDPLRRQSDAADGPPLLLGEFVRVEITGRKLTEVVVLPRTALRDGETVWLLQPDSTLNILPVTPVWRDRETVVIYNGLNSGDRIILSEVAAPVVGMQLRLDTAPISDGKRLKSSKGS